MLRTAVWLRLRTGWRSAVIWIVALGATMLLTTLSISSLYDTQAKIDGYAAATSAGDALRAINGRVYGLDTLGGVIQDEFGFVAACAMPLMGVLLMSRATRGEEEVGRTELVLAGRLRRIGPLTAALVVTTAALVLTVLALAAGLLVVGIDPSRALLYAVSLGALALVFAAAAALAAQLVPHSRDVAALGLGLLALSYVLRGFGDVRWHPLTWLSPLGWAEETRPFGTDPRWWPLLIPLAVAGVLVVAALRIRARRDIGAAVLQRDLSADTASPWLRTPLGTAVAIHRGPIITWAVVAAIVGGVSGALAQQASAAMTDNPDLAIAMGGGVAGPNAYLGMLVLITALCAAACGVQVVRTLAAEEAAGRVESLLGGGLRRLRWLGVHAVVAAAGALVVSAVGGAAVALSAAWSMGDGAQAGSVLRAQAAYLPAIAVVTGVALVLHGIRPRLGVLGWALVAFCAVVALLGDALQLPDAVSDLSPMTHVGYPPQDWPGAWALVWLVVAAGVMAVLAFARFRTRDIPG